MSGKSGEIHSKDELGGDILSLRGRIEEEIPSFFAARLAISQVVIEPKTTVSTDGLTLEERCRLFDERFPAVDGKSASEYMRELFPELEHASLKPRLPLPTVAPVLWKEGRRAGEDPPSFIKRVYEPWLGKGLSRADIRHLDFKLYTSLFNWLKKNPWPEGLDLPTLKQRNDNLVEDLRATLLDSTLSPDDVAPDERMRRGLSLFHTRGPHRAR